MKLFELRDRKINVLLQNKILEFTDKGVIVEDKDGNKKDIKADTVITSFGMRPQSELSKKICDKYSNAAISIGDGDHLGKIYSAVRNGFFAGWSIQ